ncbi:MAG: hypothetical protein VX588_01995 [Verrucomicrobiota bacterium]|nr:hypothetical protein [Verrucomicrobiota bacterium]MED5471999.1 hypothetical protein [Verrucomicrobiota bacterium]
MPNPRSNNPENIDKNQFDMSQESNGDKPDATDDPSDWIYAQESAEEDSLRELAEDIIRYDSDLASILADTVSGDSSTGELIRRISAWQAANGGGYKRARSRGSVPAKPWLS